MRGTWPTNHQWIPYQPSMDPDDPQMPKAWTWGLHTESQQGPRQEINDYYGKELEGLRRETRELTKWTCHSIYHRLSQDASPIVV